MNETTTELPEELARLFRKLIEEMLGHQVQHVFKDTSLLPLIKLIDLHEKYYHLEDATIWRISAWKTEYINIVKKAEANKLYNEILFERKEALEKIRAGYSKLLPTVDEEVIFALALKFIETNNIGAAKVVGVDISNLRRLPNVHIVLTGRNEGYEL